MASYKPHNVHLSFGTQTIDFSPKDFMLQSAEMMKILDKYISTHHRLLLLTAKFQQNHINVNIVKSCLL